MSKGNRPRAVSSVLAVAAASLALTATAGAKDGVVIQARDACDPATFPAGLCTRTDNSGGTVTFDELLAVVGKRKSHPAWRFTEDSVTVRRGESVVAEFGRGGEVHSFTDVTETGFGPGCVGLLNGLMFDGDPTTAALCGTTDPGGAGLRDILFGAPTLDIPKSGLFPGEPLPVDTSTPGRHLFQCMIHPWMRTTVTVQ